MNRNGLVMLILVALIAVAGYAFLNLQDNRDPAERIGDAISELPNGLDNAARELESRTPVERVTDDIKDAIDAEPAPRAP